MKNSLISIFLLAVIPANSFKDKKTEIDPRLVTENIFIITTDGFRWQEVFTGADSLLINNENYTPDAETVKAMYWSNSLAERRKRLMPFLWNVIAEKGQLYGNRYFNNRMNVANAFAKSYPGYNEIFTGMADPAISSNRKNYNRNINVLEHLNKKQDFAGKVVAFTSWDVFPYILNDKRSNIPVNSGYEESGEINAGILSKVQEGINDKTATRYDQLTFIAAKEYIQKNQPRVLYLGLGETDEFAHQGRYDLYLQQANQVDKMIAELWHWVQTTPGYKDNTTFIITTDHGRGSKTSKWTSHGEFIKGSSQTWLAVIGPRIQPLGEIKEEGQLYQQQLAQTTAHLLGQNFSPGNIASAITLKAN